MKIFIGGARTQKDLDTAVKKRIQNIADGGYTILVGDCYGIDASPSAKGFEFYAQKDKAMAKDADFGLMVWDGKSKGTLNNMINLLLQEKSVLLYLVYHFHKEGYCHPAVSTRL